MKPFSDISSALGAKAAQLLRLKKLGQQERMDAKAADRRTKDGSDDEILSPT